MGNAFAKKGRKPTHREVFLAQHKLEMTRAAAATQVARVATSLGQFRIGIKQKLHMNDNETAEALAMTWIAMKREHMNAMQRLQQLVIMQTRIQSAMLDSSMMEAMDVFAAISDGLLDNGKTDVLASKVSAFSKADMSRQVVNNQLTSSFALSAGQQKTDAALVKELIQHLSDELQHEQMAHLPDAPRLRSVVNNNDLEERMERLLSCVEAKSNKHGGGTGGGGDANGSGGGGGGEVVASASASAKCVALVDVPSSSSSVPSETSVSTV